MKDSEIRSERGVIMDEGKLLKRGTFLLVAEN
jgi:hypothetical protein